MARSSTVSRTSAVTGERRPRLGTLAAMLTEIIQTPDREMEETYCIKRYTNI